MKNDSFNQIVFKIVFSKMIEVIDKMLLGKFNEPIIVHIKI